MPHISKEKQTKLSGKKDSRASAFSLEDHRTRMAKVWTDFEKYRGLLSNLNMRVKSLEDGLKQDSDI